MERRPRGRALALAALASALLTGCPPNAPQHAPAAAPAKKYEAPEERFVFFASGKADIVPDGFFAVGYVCAMLDQNPAMHVLVVGHADSRGRSDANKDLSFRRARAVRKVLMDHGIKEARILIAAPKEGNEPIQADLSRRADLFVYDPIQDEASTRLGYGVEVRRD